MASYRRLRTAGALAFALTVAGCFPEPAPINPARIECFRACARQKDACVLGATNATALQDCDNQSAACGNACPQ